MQTTAQKHSTKFDAYPVSPENIPDETIAIGRYEVRYARTPAELDALFRLRFDVFNVELNEGLDVSYETGRDEDEFDQHCHHLYLLDTTTGEVIGTYRMQTFAMANQGIGLYSATEFDFDGAPRDVLDLSVETGRACIHRDHRSMKVLYLLWRGLGLYMAHNRMRYLFGCCSLTSQNEIEGLAVHRYLHEHEHILEDWAVNPLPGRECRGTEEQISGFESPKIPKLMRAYLTLGATICGPPAIDRVFKTIDYLALFDVESLSTSALAFYRVKD